MNNSSTRKGGKKEIDKSFMNPQVAVDCGGSMCLMKDGHCIYVEGKLKKAIAEVMNLTLWI